MKRLLSVLLVCCMVLSMVPAVAAAEGNTAAVSNEGLTLEGSNALGSMLVQEVQDQQDAQQEDASGGYVIQGVTVEGKTATVEFDSMEAAQLMVGIYTEDGSRLLLSGKTEITPDLHEAQVTLTGTMPKYFLVRAFLLDHYDYSPLCKSYTTPMYTQEMQNLLASTAEDYDQDRVLTLSEDTSTNFVVYQDDTLVIRPESGVNTLVSADDENRIYVLENVDAEVTGLQKDDVVAYELSADDVLVIKVGAVSVSGSTVRITGQDVELEEAFAYMKLEQAGDAGDMEADETQLPDEGITFEGIEEPDRVPTRAASGQISMTKGLAFSMEKEIASAGAASVTISAEYKLQTGIYLDFYISGSQRFVEFKVDYRLEGTFAATGKVELKASLGVYAVNLYGVIIGFAPELQLNFSAEISLSVAMVTTLGFAYEKNAGFQNLCAWPHLEEPEFSLQGTVYIGIDLCPTIRLLSGDVAKFDIHIPFGLELKADPYRNPHYENLEDYEGTVHHCDYCIEMTLYFKFAPKVELKFLNCEFLKVEWEILTTRVKLQDMFYTVDTGSFGLGVCPNKSFRVAVAVEDAANKSVPGATVVYDEAPFSYDNALGTTNENGVAGTYMRPGNYTFRTTLNGQSYEYTHYIQQAGKVVLGPNVKNGRNFIAEKIDPSSLVDDGKVIKSGSCGDGVQYELYESGHLFITGAGTMDNWAYDYKVPWHYQRDQITHVIVDDEVRNIGPQAFRRCYNLKSVYLGESVQTIHSYAFAECQILESVNLPDGLIKLDHYAFEDCLALKEITIPEKVNYIGNGVFRDTHNLEKVVYNAVNVTCPDENGTPKTYTHRFDISGCDSGGITLIIGKNVQQIPAYMFGWGSSSSNHTYPTFKSVTFEEGSVCKEIGEKAFYLTRGLTEMILPEGLEIIGDYAFNDTDFSTIYIPSTVTSIGKYAFYWADITELNLPASITTLGDSAFSACDQLKKVTFNSGVEKIPYHAFERCYALEQVQLCDGTAVIGEKAFGECTSLKEIRLPDTVTSIGNYAFAQSAITQIRIPDGVTDIGRNAFQKCTALEYIVIPDGVTTIENYTFQGCTGLTEAVIGSGVKKINTDAFAGNTSLATITFYGSAPTTISSWAFEDVTATVYYPYGNSSWSSWKRTDYGGDLTWVSYQPGERSVRQTPMETAQQTEPVAQTKTVTRPQTRAVYPGNQTVGDASGNVGCTAKFTDLVPGQEYVMLVLASMETQDLLAAGNVLYIYQAAADENGVLEVYYERPVINGPSYIMACGAAYDDISQATVEFPIMGTDGALQAIDPVVTYEGQVLTEGEDYVLVGTVDFTAAGTYSCYIRGIYDYTGMIPCTYTVRGDVTTVHTEQWDKVTLQQDANLSLVLTQDMYLDLNGYALTGTVNTGSYDLYLMDSATNGYSAANAGSFQCEDEAGGAYVPAATYTVPAAVAGEDMQYLALPDGDGYSFHRYRLEVTHMSIDPAKTAVGYKAVFYGDEAVLASLDSGNALGFSMQLDGFDTHSRYLPLSQVTNGRVVTMRISNYMVEEYGQTKLRVCMRMKLKNGTVVESAPCAYTLREMVELVNADPTAYSTAKLEALAEMIRRYPVMKDWDISNLPQ